MAFAWPTLAHEAHSQPVPAEAELPVCVALAKSLNFYDPVFIFPHSVFSSVEYEIAFLTGGHPRIHWVMWMEPGCHEELPLEVPLQKLPGGTGPVRHRGCKEGSALTACAGKGETGWGGTRWVLDREAPAALFLQPRMNASPRRHRAVSGRLVVVAESGCCWHLVGEARHAAVSFSALDTCTARHGPLMLRQRGQLGA